MADDAMGGAPVESLNGGSGSLFPRLLARPEKKPTPAPVASKPSAWVGTQAEDTTQAQEDAKAKTAKAFEKIQAKVATVTQPTSASDVLHPPVAWNNLNWLDWGIVGCLLISLLISLMRGAMRELISIGSWVLGIWLAFHFSDQASIYLSQWINNNSAKVAASIALLFIFALVCGKVIQVVISKCIEWGGLTILDRFVGFWFGLVRGVLCITLLLMLAKTIDMHHTMAWHQSCLIPYFDPMLEWFAAWLPGKMHHLMVWLGVSVETVV